MTEVRACNSRVLGRGERERASSIRDMKMCQSWHAHNMNEMSYANYEMLIFLPRSQMWSDLLLSLKEGQSVCRRSMPMWAADVEMAVRPCVRLMVICCENASLFASDPTTASTGQKWIVRVSSRLVACTISKWQDWRMIGSSLTSRMALEWRWAE